MAVLINGRVWTGTKAAVGLEDVVEAAGAVGSLEELDAVLALVGAKCEAGELGRVEATALLNALGRSLDRLEPATKARGQPEAKDSDRPFVPRGKLEFGAPGPVLSVGGAPSRSEP